MEPVNRHMTELWMVEETIKANSSESYYGAIRFCINYRWLIFYICMDKTLVEPLRLYVAEVIIWMRSAFHHQECPIGNNSLGHLVSHGLRDFICP
jgi:hypothetical protein